MSIVKQSFFEKVLTLCFFYSDTSDSSDKLKIVKKYQCFGLGLLSEMCQKKF